MNLVVVADDAFSFLLAWEFMSLSSWALVMAHHREPANAHAGYVYLVMASFGTLSLLLAFGLLAGPSGGYAFEAIRSADPPLRHVGPRPGSGAAGRGIQSRTRASARLAAARPPRGAQSRLGADERRHDQGRGVRLRAHRVRPARSARVVVERRRPPARRRHRGSRRAVCPDAARSETPARLPHRREHRHHLHRPRACPGVPGQRHAAGGCAGAHGCPVPRPQPLAVQEPPVLRRRARC